MSNETVNEEVLEKAIEEYIMFEYDLCSSIERNAKDDSNPIDVSIVKLSREYVEWGEFKMGDSFRRKPINLKRAQKFASKMPKGVDMDKTEVNAQSAKASTEANASAELKATKEALAKAIANAEATKKALDKAKVELADAKAEVEKANAPKEKTETEKAKEHLKEKVEEAKVAVGDFWDSLKSTVSSNRAKIAFIGGVVGMYAAKAGLDAYGGKTPGWPASDE